MNFSIKKAKHITLISIKKLKAEDQPELIKTLTELTEKVIEHLPGFISAKFYRSLDGTRVVNCAQWESREDWESAMMKNADVKPYLDKVHNFETSLEDFSLYELVYTNDMQHRIKKMTKQASKFSHSFEEHIDISATPKDLYNALYQMRDWPKYLPHVKKIDVIFDDGQYQEFWMRVDSPKGELNVLSMRNCKNNKIIFYQPRPPDFLLHHAGCWNFIPLDNNKCRLKTFHTWDINQNVAAGLFPSKDYINTEKQIEILLKDHAKFTIESWKKVFEEGRRKK